MKAAKRSEKILRRIECPVCADTMIYGFRKFGYSFFQCRGCGFGCFSPRPSREEILNRYTDKYFRNEYLGSYGADWDHYNMELIRRRFGYIESRLLSDYTFPSSGKSVLDVGCGGGFLLKCFQERGWRTLGVDIIESSVQYSSERLGVPAVQADFEHVSVRQLQAPGDGFNLITLTDALEHFFDPRKVLEKTYRMLDEGGVVFISVPNINSLSLTYLGKSWAIISPLEHISYFSSVSLERMLRQAGFSNISIQVLQYVNVANVHQRTLRVRLGRYLAFLASRFFGIAFEGREAYDDILSQEYFRLPNASRPQGDVLVALGQKFHE